MTSNAQFTITLVASILSSAGVLGVIQHFLTRRARREDEDRKQRQDVRDQEAEIRRQAHEEDLERAVLRKAQTQSQLDALHSEGAINRRITKENGALRHSVAELANGLGILIDVFEAQLTRFRPSRSGETYTATVQAVDITHARKAITEARKHLTPGLVPLGDEDIDQ